VLTQSLPIACPKPCNSTPFSALAMSLYLVFRGPWPDLAYGISEVWALDLKFWFQGDLWSFIIITVKRSDSSDVKRWVQSVSILDAYCSVFFPLPLQPAGQHLHSAPKRTNDVSWEPLETSSCLAGSVLFRVSLCESLSPTVPRDFKLLDLVCLMLVGCYPKELAKFLIHNHWNSFEMEKKLKKINRPKQ
jgi:hypothetical protein